MCHILRLTLPKIDFQLPNFCLMNVLPYDGFEVIAPSYNSLQMYTFLTT